MPWTEKSMAGYSPRAQRVGHNWVTITYFQGSKRPIGTIMIRREEDRGGRRSRRPVQPRAGPGLMQRAQQMNFWPERHVILNSRSLSNAKSWPEPTINHCKELSYGTLKGHLEKPMWNNLERPITLRRAAFQKVFALTFSLKGSVLLLKPTSDAFPKELECRNDFKYVESPLLQSPLLLQNKNHD